MANFFEKIFGLKFKEELQGGDMNSGGTSINENYEEALWERYRIEQIGARDLSDEEMDIVYEIFDTMPDDLVLTSSYVAFRFSGFDIRVSDDMIEYFKSLRSSRPEEDERAQVLDKILESRSKAVLTVEVSVANEAPIDEGTVQKNSAGPSFMGRMLKKIAVPEITHGIRQIGFLDPSDEERMLFRDIFENIPGELTFTSSYPASRFSVYDILITDEMIAHLSNLRSSRPEEDEMVRLIDKILDLRNNPMLIIE